MDIINNGKGQQVFMLELFNKIENIDRKGKVMAKKTALITGCTGQDGSYLAELLLSKGYKVVGTVRRSSLPNTVRVDHLLKEYPDDNDPDCPFRLLYADLTDTSSVRNVIELVEPDEVYNLAAQSQVGISYYTGESTLDINAMGPYRILDTLRRMGAVESKYYQASSSEMFGASPPPQNEETHFLPQSPYGISKVAAFYLTRMHRVSYGMFAANGILFNHESPRRGWNFVTRKATRGIADIITGEKEKLYFGNLDTKRDWGFSGDYVEAIWRILQHHEPDDFVIATEEMHTIKIFIQEAFNLVGLYWEDFVVHNTERYKRPSEVPALLGDSSKARRILGWEPKVKFKELTRMMVESDLNEKGLTFEQARKAAKTIRRSN
jgi:GDPmannose 4,6-dehydratase